MFNLQGHRGARGLKPENTLPSIEVALDVGVNSIETDLHLTRDGFVVLVHDAEVSERLFQPVRQSPILGCSPAISSLNLSDLRQWRANRNPDPARFPTQDAGVTPLAAEFAADRSIDPFTPPTLEELFSFVVAYAGESGRAAGKSDEQRRSASQVGIDLELKRVPFRPETIGDGFTGDDIGVLEQRVLEALQRFDLWDRVSVRSFDHRCILAIKRQEPKLRTGVLVAGTAPVSPVTVVRDAEASIYCPDYHFLAKEHVEQLHDAGYAVLPWTVNDKADWQRLLSWGVAGITTDYPNRLADVR
jgi:glycerophosphoryl diester phosphodiesterase